MNKAINIENSNKNVARVLSIADEKFSIKRRTT